MDRTIHDFGHATVPIMCGDIEIQIDVIIAELISIIWKKNIKTQMSCGGTPGAVGAAAWINFNGVSQAKYFMSHIVNHFSLKTWQFRSHFMENDKLHGIHTKFNENEFVFRDITVNPESLIITIAFPQTHISKVTQLMSN